MTSYRVYDNYQEEIITGIIITVHLTKTLDIIYNWRITLYIKIKFVNGHKWNIWFVRSKSTFGKSTFGKG